MRVLQLLTAVACLINVNRACAEVSWAEDHIVVDGATLRFDEDIEVDGVCLGDRSRRYSNATAMQALRIGRNATQEDLEFHLEFNDDKPAAKGNQSERLQKAKHYRIRGTLLNARINGLDNVCRLRVNQLQEIPPAELKVADFIDRTAIFEGIAAPGGCLKYGTEIVALDGNSTWPSDIEGKHVSVSGTVRKTSDALLMEGATWKLYRLDEMLNGPVVLEGRIASLNDHWWFDYRGERMYLISELGPELQFSSVNHYRAVRVSGHLVQQDRPSFEQISLKEARDLVPTYVVRAAKVEPVEPLMSWEAKFGTVYRSATRLIAGVPELIAEPSARRNLMGNETDARLFVERNSEAIGQTLREISLEHRNELARRMTDKSTNEVLQLVYAAMLANVNDDRGCEFLLNATRIRDGDLDLNALYCLGIVPYLVGEKREVELGWAKERMIELLGTRTPVRLHGMIVRRNDVQEVPVSSAVIIYSAIPSVLRQIGTDDCRHALMDFVSSPGDYRDVVAMELCRWSPSLTAGELLDLDKLLQSSAVHRTVLKHCLIQKLPEVVKHFADDLNDSFVYMQFRDRLSPEVVKGLTEHLPEMKGKAFVHSRTLIALGQQDPVEELLKLLDDPKWQDKNIVFFELSRLADPRAVEPVFRFLCDAPPSAVEDDGGLSPTSTVRNAIKAIAHTGTSEAIHALIELLPVDLARFGGYRKREEWPLMVAAHLIELTGESFGVDVDKWRKWQKQHPDHHVPGELANPSSAFRTNSNGVIDFGE